MTPTRIQRKRTKGYTTPPNTIYVGRPTIFGNPFSLKEYSREEAYSKYRWYVTVRMSTSPEFRKQINSLRGKNLSCFCPEGEKCHADILIELSNK